MGSRKRGNWPRWAKNPKRVPPRFSSEEEEDEEGPKGEGGSLFCGHFRAREKRGGMGLTKEVEEVGGWKAVGEEDKRFAKD